MMEQEEIGARNSPDHQITQKGLSGSTIKIIAIIAMLIDHIAAVLIARVLINNGMQDKALWGLMMIMRCIGRLGFPIFCFLLIEGFQKTSSRLKYAIRLGVFALVSEIPFDLALRGKSFETGYQNVFFTLLIGMLTIWALEALSDYEMNNLIKGIVTVFGIGSMTAYWTVVFRKQIQMILAALPVEKLSEFGLSYEFFKRMETGITVVSFIIIFVVLGIVLIILRSVKGNELVCRIGTWFTVLALGMTVADLLHTDYSGMGVLTIVAMYLFRKNRVLSFAMGCIVLTAMSSIEAFSFLALIPIGRYNGERGLRMKYFFYAFYPLHLLIIWLIAYFMGLGGIAAV